MNPRLASIAIVVLVVLVFGGRFVKTVPPGFVSVATLFGAVIDEPFDEGLHLPVNPLYQWVDFDVRQKTLKETAQIPTRDQLQTRVDVSVQYRFIAAMTPQVLQDTGDTRSAVEVHLIPVLRSQVRDQGSKIARAEDFFLEETRSNLEAGLLSSMQETLASKGFNIQAVLIRDINLPEVLARAIEQKKEREQAVERQKAELERFRTEQLQQVAQAEAERKAAEEQAQMIKVLADAKAYEILAIQKAISTNPAYIQLQSLEALKAMAKDPAAKLYFMDSNATQPLPLLHMGDRQ